MSETTRATDHRDTVGKHVHSVPPVLRGVPVHIVCRGVHRDGAEEEIERRGFGCVCGTDILPGRILPDQTVNCRRPYAPQALIRAGNTGGLHDRGIFIRGKIHRGGELFQLHRLLKRGPHHLCRKFRCADPV